MNNFQFGYFRVYRGKALYGEVYDYYIKNKECGYTGRIRSDDSYVYEESIELMFHKLKLKAIELGLPDSVLDLELEDAVYD